jgi:uncharacterized SAM-binding protein YcdF (DUF218 family)
MITAGLLTAGVEFTRRMEPSPLAEGLPKNAVVFTGQFDRVFAGLEILRQGRIKNLFISGVNRGAGIEKERFAGQFSLDANLKQALASGRLDLGEQAQNTLENAAETTCWYNKRGLSGPLLLITSCLHMPRSSLALERSLPAVDVVRMCLASGANHVTMDTLIREFMKFIVTLAAAPSGGFCAPARAAVRARLACGWPAAPFETKIRFRGATRMQANKGKFEKAECQASFKVLNSTRTGCIS